MFDTQNGLPSITPSKTIKEIPYGGLDIYENINGIPGITRPSNPIPMEVMICTKTKIESLLSHRLLLSRKRMSKGGVIANYTQREINYGTGDTFRVSYKNGI